MILFINPNVHVTRALESDLAFKLFRLMYDRYNAANVVFICASNSNAYNIYVTNPYHNETHCGNRFIPLLTYVIYCFVYSRVSYNVYIIF